MILSRLISIGVLVVVLCGLHPSVLAQTSPSSDREKAKAKIVEGDNYLHNKQLLLAKQAYQRAIELDPLWYKPYEALGNLHFSARQYVDAIEAFMKAIEVEPRYHTGYYNIAFAYRKSQNYEKAIKYYKRYLQRNPSDPDAYYGMAASYELVGKIPEAIDAYQRYAQMEKRPSEKKYVIKARQKAELLSARLGPKETKPKKPARPSGKKPELQSMRSTSRPEGDKQLPKANAKIKHWIELGDKAYKKKAYSKAMKYYYDAAREQPDNVDAVYKLGLVYQNTGNDRAARLKFSIVLKLDPNHQGAQAAMAKFGAATSQSKQAAEVSTMNRSTNTTTRTSIEADPKQKQIKILESITQGDEYFKNKAYSKAISSYTHATQLDPSNEQAQFKLAMAYALAGNLKVAIFKWQQVLHINPNNERAKGNITKAKARLEKLKNSESVQGKLVSSKPNKHANVTKADRFASLLAQAKAAKERGDAPGVLQTTKQALEIRQDAKVAILRGEALVVLKRFDEAKKIFAKAMVINPNLAAPLYGLGYSCQESGEKERARYYFRMYVRSKAKDVKPELVNLAKEYLRTM